MFDSFDLDLSPEDYKPLKNKMPVQGAVSGYLGERRLIRAVADALGSNESELSIPHKKVQEIHDHLILGMSSINVNSALEILTRDGLETCLLFILNCKR